MDGRSKNEISGNIFSQKYNFSAVNPFSGEFNPANAPQQNTVQNATNPIKRLNGYDSTILNQTKFDEGETEDLSIEYRIKEKESTIKDLDAKIKVADNYGTQNEALGLKAKRQRVMEELTTLRKQQMYGGRVLGEKKQLTHNSLKERMPVIYKIQDFISRHILARVSKKIHSVQI
jgi:hypothetical protein